MFVRAYFCLVQAQKCFSDYTKSRMVIMSDKKTQNMNTKINIIMLPVLTLLSDIPFIALSLLFALICLLFY